MTDTAKGERADGQLSGLSGEFFVAAELLKRGMQTSVTFGNAKGIDILAFNPKTGRSFTVQVKTVRSRNYFLLSHARVDARHLYVFVVLNSPDQPVEYFVVPGMILASSPGRFSKWFLDPKMPGIHPKVLEQEGFKGRWDYFDEGDAGFRNHSNTGQDPDPEQNEAPRLFKDDEPAYRAWLHSNPDAFVLNARNPPTKSYLVVHRAACRDVGRESHTTGQYLKIGARNVDLLQEWAAANVGGQITRCKHCTP